MAKIQTMQQVYKFDANKNSEIKFRFVRVENYEVADANYNITVLHSSCYEYYTLEMSFTKDSVRTLILEAAGVKGCRIINRLLMGLRELELIFFCFIKSILVSQSFVVSSYLQLRKVRS